MCHTRLRLRHTINFFRVDVYGMSEPDIISSPIQLFSVGQWPVSEFIQRPLIRWVVGEDSDLQLYSVVRLIDPDAPLPVTSVSLKLPSLKSVSVVSLTEPTVPPAEMLVTLLRSPVVPEVSADQVTPFQA